MTSPSEVFRSRLREVRRLKGWTQQELSDALKAVGVKLDASAITRLEGGTRGVTLDDVVAIAAVLGVSPLHMIVQLENDALLEVAPEITTGPVGARAWFRGQHTLREGDDVPLFYAQTPEDDWDAIEPGLQFKSQEDFEALRAKWEKEIYRRWAAFPGGSGPRLHAGQEGDQ